MGCNKTGDPVLGFLHIAIALDHADEHSGKPQELGEYEDGKHHPEGGKPGGIAEDLRAEDVAVELLEQEDKHQKHKRLDRVLGEDDDKGRNRPDERPEVGNYIGDTDNDAHKHDIGHIQQRHPDEAEHADDGRVDDLAGDEAAEDGVGLPGQIEQEAGVLLTEEGVHDLAHLRQKALLSHKHIDRNDDANHQIEHAAGKVHRVFQRLGQGAHRKVIRLGDGAFHREVHRVDDLLGQPVHGDELHQKIQHPLK